MAHDNQIEFATKWIELNEDTLLDPSLPANHPYNVMNRLGILTVKILLDAAALASGKSILVNGAWDRIYTRQKENLMRERARILQGKSNLIDSLLDQGIVDLCVPLDIVNGAIAGYFDAADPLVQHSGEWLTTINSLIESLTHHIFDSAKRIDDYSRATSSDFSFEVNATKSIVEELAQKILKLAPEQKENFSKKIDNSLDKRINEKIRDLYTRGEEYCKKPEPDYLNAFSAFAEVTQFDPKNVEAWIKQAQCYWNSFYSQKPVTTLTLKQQLDESIFSFSHSLLYGVEGAQAARRGAQRGAVNGLIGMINLIMHPVDNFFYPVTQVLYDAMVVGAASFEGYIIPDPFLNDLTIVKQKIKENPEFFADSFIRMQQLVAHLNAVKEKFATGTDAERAEMLAEATTTFYAPCAVVKAIKALSNLYHYKSIFQPPIFYNTKYYQPSAIPTPEFTLLSAKDIKQTLGEKEFLWVLTEERKLLISEYMLQKEVLRDGWPSKDLHHHELAGAIQSPSKGVLGAGHLITYDGNIRLIQNRTGHFLTDDLSFWLPTIKTYDFGKMVEGFFEKNGFLDAPGKYKQVIIPESARNNRQPIIRFQRMLSPIAELLLGSGSLSAPKDKPQIFSSANAAPITFTEEEVKQALENPTAWLNIGQAQLTEGGSQNTQLAIESFSQYINANPGDFRGYLGRGFALIQQGKINEAIHDLTIASMQLAHAPSALNTERSTVYFYLSWANWKVRDYEKAMSNIDKALSFNPDNEEAKSLKRYYQEALGERVSFDYLSELKVPVPNVRALDPSTGLLAPPPPRSSVDSPAPSEIILEALAIAGSPEEGSLLSEEILEALAEATQPQPSSTASANVQNALSAATLPEQAPVLFSEAINQALALASVTQPVSSLLTSSIQDALAFAEQPKQDPPLSEGISNALAAASETSSASSQNVQNALKITTLPEQTPKLFSAAINQALAFTFVMQPISPPLIKEIQDALALAEKDQLNAPSDLSPVIHGALAAATKPSPKDDRLIPGVQPAAPLSKDILGALALAKTSTPKKPIENAPTKSKPTPEASPATKDKPVDKGSDRAQVAQPKTTVAKSESSKAASSSGKGAIQAPVQKAPEVKKQESKAEPAVKQAVAQKTTPADKAPPAKTTVTSKPPISKEVKKLEKQFGHLKISGLDTSPTVIEVEIVPPPLECVSIPHPLSAEVRLVRGQRITWEGAAHGTYCRVRGSSGEYLKGMQGAYDIIDKSTIVVLEKRPDGKGWVNIATSKVKELLSHLKIADAAKAFGAALGPSIAIPLTTLINMFSPTGNGDGKLKAPSKMSGHELLTHSMPVSTHQLFDKLSKITEKPSAYTAAKKQTEALFTGLTKQFELYNPRKPNKLAIYANKAFKSAERAVRSEKARVEEVRQREAERRASSSDSYSSSGGTGSGHDGSRDRKGGCSDRATANETSSGNSNSYSYTKCDYNSDGSKQCESGTGTFGSGLGGGCYGSQSVTSRW